MESTALIGVVIGVVFILGLAVGFQAVIAPIIAMGF